MYWLFLAIQIVLVSGSTFLVSDALSQFVWQGWAVMIGVVLAIVDLLVPKFGQSILPFWCASALSTILIVVLVGNHADFPLSGFEQHNSMVLGTALVLAARLPVMGFVHLYSKE